MADKMSKLRSRQLPRGGIPTKALTYSSRLYREFAEDIGKRNEGHIATYFKDNSRQVLSIISAPGARSSAPAGNYIMVAITDVVH